MARPAAEIADAIDQFQPDHGDWLGLDELLDELFQRDLPDVAFDSLLGVFERFPTDDGAGVFWSILHGLESLPGYESHLVKSIQTNPSEFSLIMVHRLLNSGVEKLDETRCLALLEDVAQNQSTSEVVRNTAKNLCDKHSNPS